MAASHEDAASPADPARATPTTTINPPSRDPVELKVFRPSTIVVRFVQATRDSLERKHLRPEEEPVLSRFSLLLLAGVAIVLYLASYSGLESTGRYWAGALLLLACFAWELWQGLRALYAFVMLDVFRPYGERLDQYRIALGINFQFWNQEVAQHKGEESVLINTYVTEHFPGALRRTILDHAVKFSVLWLRLLVACAVTSLALIGWDRVHPTEKPRSVFGQVPHELRTLSDHVRLSVDDVYMNVVTVGTTGFGNLEPVTLAGKIMATLQIVVGVFYLAVGFDILIAVAVEVLRNGGEDLESCLANYSLDVAKKQWNFNP